ncbi:small rab-related GTPase [Baffinella frigidus]|nr:small rab-related GTPase [Cryptophyta sp. CCMP2293]
MSLVEDFETTIKVIVVGNGGVGKSSMIRKFCTGEFTDTYKKTIGVDFLEKEQYINSIGQNITFMVWDTAGQEEFDALTKQYYRNAQGCVIAFSSVDRASFEAVESWKAKVEAEVSDCAMVLVQNKVDLIDKAVASSEEVEELAKRLNLKLYRTCVSENLNVNKVNTILNPKP